jgi:hypothetical protein
MAEYKYKIPVYQIVDEDGLKFLFFYNTNVLPQIGDTIVNLIQDNTGKFVRRLYFKVQERLLPTLLGDVNEVNHFENEILNLQVTLEVDEPVTNWIQE